MADGSMLSELPSSNRGVSETERLPVIVDYLAASIDLFSSLAFRPLEEPESDIIESINGGGDLVRDVAERINSLLFGDTFALAADITRGRFYRYRVKLCNAFCDYVGLIEMGGTETMRDGRYTARIEMTGHGCRLFEAAGCDHAKRWSLLATMLGAVSARITRVDLAADDYAGRWPIRWALDHYEMGAFDKRGQRPKPKLIDDMGSGEGKTFYVGSRKSENMLRVYEKGREQGDPASEWVRYEAQITGSNRRQLPLEILTLCDEYLRGAYPALHFVGGVGQSICSISRSVAASAVKAVRHFKRQYGAFANLVLQAGEGCEQTVFRLLRGVSRQTVPKWYSGGASNLNEFREAIPI